MSDSADLLVPDAATRESYLLDDATLQDLANGRKRTPSTGGYMPAVVHWDSALCARVLCAILKQLAEKLDVVRECAGKYPCLESAEVAMTPSPCSRLSPCSTYMPGEVLTELLASDRPRIPSIPDRVALEVAMAPGEDSSAGRVNWASPAQSFPRLVKLIALEPYHEVGPSNKAAACP